MGAEEEGETGRQTACGTLKRIVVRVEKVIQFPAVTGQHLEQDIAPKQKLYLKLHLTADQEWVAPAVHRPISN